MNPYIRSGQQPWTDGIEEYSMTFYEYKVCQARGMSDEDIKVGLLKASVIAKIAIHDMMTGRTRGERVGDE